MRVLALAVMLAGAGCGGECPSPVSFGRAASECAPGESCPAHATCSPSDRAWTTYGPDVLHCEWRCVQYGCEVAPQDVTAELAFDGTVLSVTQADAQGCP
jgi:hypothetical protein